MRLVDFITMSIMPFVMPDKMPEDKEKVKKRITEAYKTNYMIELFNTKIFLKPNFLLEEALKVNAPYITVNNSIVKTKNRNLTNIGNEYFTEDIEISLSKVDVEGFYKGKKLIVTPQVKVYFSRFLFFNELIILEGLSHLLRNVHFGTKIDIASKSLDVSLFKDDFFYLITTIYNNLAYSD